MFTAVQALEMKKTDLDLRIENAVREAPMGARSATIRIYSEDNIVDSIQAELELRGFRNIVVPYMILKGDVYFEW